MYLCPGLPLGMVPSRGNPKQQAALLSKCVLGLELEWQPDAWPGHPAMELWSFKTVSCTSPSPHSLAGLSHCGREGGHCQLEVVTLGKESSLAHTVQCLKPQHRPSPWVSSCPSGPILSHSLADRTLEISFEC